MSKDIFDELSTWREERGLNHIKVSSMNVLKHMLIELTEAMEGITNDDFDEVIDGICDCIVYGINGLEQMDVNASIAMQETIKEIHSRKGYYNVTEGKFQKNITGKEYKANYTLALRGASVGGQSTAYDESVDH